MSYDTTSTLTNVVLEPEEQKEVQQLSIDRTFEWSYKVFIGNGKSSTAYENGLKNVPKEDVKQLFMYFRKKGAEGSSFNLAKKVLETTFESGMTLTQVIHHNADARRLYCKPLLNPELRELSDKLDSYRVAKKEKPKPLRIIGEDFDVQQNTYSNEWVPPPKMRTRDLL